MNIWLPILVLFWTGSTGYSYSAHEAWHSESMRDNIDDNFDIVFPERINKGRTKRDLSTGSKNGHDEEATFKLRAFGKDVVVEVHLNKIVSSPQFTLRYFKENGQLVHRKEAPPNCQYQGHLKGHEAQSTVILDTCHGLSGLIEDEESRMYIEPYPEKGEGAHKIFKTKDGKKKIFLCGTSLNGNTTADGLSNSLTKSRIKREAEESVYKKYLTTTKTRYTELMIIVDNAVYKKYKQDINDVKRRVFTLVNAVDTIYRKINIRVVLSALEIWTDEDHVPFVKRAGDDLRNFGSHHSSREAGVTYDSIHLLRGVMWDDYGGMAYRGEICTRRSLGVDAWNYWGSLGPWLALSHELGHNFNFDHDNIWSCKCLSPRGCVMGSFKTRVPGFSDCNLLNMTKIDDSCLYNLPKKAENSRCGNGIPEPGEQCDCGTPEECRVRDPCCQPNDCRLKKSSQCSDAQNKCCRKCQFSPLGTLCRKSIGVCDVAEVCSGKSAQCPLDDHVKDGSLCAGMGKSFCYHGKCAASADFQCRALWGAGASSAPRACYEKLNIEAQGFGTCSGQTNLPCAREHAVCGQLQCSSPRDRPVVDYGSYYELKVLPTGEKCRAAIRKGGNGKEFDGMVKDGTVCGNNKICVKNRCTHVGRLISTTCPRAGDGKECAGKGICTNKGKCHCLGNLDPDTACTTAKQVRHGRWGAWSKWSPCSKVCGGGMKTRYRFCDSPAPAHGGRDCGRKRTGKSSCNTDNCPVAHSCHHLLSLGKQTGVQFPDGVYTINPDGKGPVKTYCDMTRDGGGWTLLVTSHTNTWTADNIKQRNPNRPTLNGDFSILYKADDIKNSLNVAGEWFEYRIEGHERGRWGGIWRAPREYTFVATDNKQTFVELVKKFDNWKYDDYGVEKRMPWISGPKLTTSWNATGDRQWGTLIANSKIFFPAPWLDGKDLEQHPVNIWYWVREQSFSPPRSCAEIQLRGSYNKPLTDGLYTIKPGHRQVQTFCKFSDHGGAWTLVLTSASDNGWARDNVKSRNTHNPSLSSDFSLLGMADNITKMKHFQYLMEEDGAKTWEGVWTGNAGCSFTSGRSDGACVKLVHEQGHWDASQVQSTKRLPRLTTSGYTLLTSADDQTNLNGAIVLDATHGVSRARTGAKRLWVREGTWRSCNEIKSENRGNKAAEKDGLYFILRNSHEYLPVYCDMTSEQGAYTLLVTSASNGWKKNEVKLKNPTRPLLSRDYSILEYADQIKALSGAKRFKYRLEANERRHWGGVWTAPMRYSFVNENNQQTDVSLVKRYNVWRYNWQDSLEKRMPWLGARSGLLTTSTHSDYSEWGTIISEKKSNNPAPWIYGVMTNPGLIWYWMNEGKIDKKPTPVYVAESPIRAYGGFCLQPESKDCSPADNTRLVYIKDKPECSKDYMMFTHHKDILTHKCSGKKVCPLGTVTWQTSLVLSSTCQSDASKFQRTVYTTLRHTASGFCVHPLSGTPISSTTAIMWKDDCSEDRLRLDFLKLQVFDSPIQVPGGFCLQPESASCNPADNSPLVYHQSSRCDKYYMYFTYKDEVLMHTCSGKRVCPEGRGVTADMRLVLSSTCDLNVSKFQRTPHKTLKHEASGFCVHPYRGQPMEGVPAVFWKDDCNEPRLILDLYKLRGPG